MSFSVKVGADSRFARRTARGSSPSSPAIWSSRLSNAKRTSTVPWPRNAPQGGVLVSTRLASYLTLCSSEGVRLGEQRLADIFDVVQVVDRVQHRAGIEDGHHAVAGMGTATLV